MERPEWTPDEIRDLRTRLQLTRAEFAPLVDASERTVEGWEQGRVRPGPDKLARLTYLATDRSQRAIGGANTLREVATHADLDAMLDGRESPYAASLRRIADNMEREATTPS